MFYTVTEECFEAMAKLIVSEREHFFVFPSATYPMTAIQIKERVEHKKEFIMIVEEEELIGFANLYDDEENKHVFIGNFVIAEIHRNQGYGTKLIRHMLQLAGQKYQLPEIRISVVHTNPKAFYWYSYLGFKPYGVEVIDDGKLTFVHMKMDLSKT